MKLLWIGTFLILPLVLGACREQKEVPKTKKKEEETTYFKTEPEDVAELKSNRLSNEPSDFLRSHANSEINWQPWSNEVLDLASRSQRMIFVLVGSTTYPNAHQLAGLLEKKFKDEINEQYVPVMADSTVDPSLALACHQLGLEQGDSISFPYLLWLSHEGNAVAWIPVNTGEEEDLLLGFRRAQNTVSAIRNQSPRYVVENSRYDNEGRVSRIEGALALKEEQLELQPKRAELFLIAQGLTDLYDHLDRTFDNTGGLPPGNLITTISRLAQHPASPPRLQRSAERAARESLELLASSAVRDPLDGYFFARRASRSFSVPALSKNLDTQAEMLSAIASSPFTPASERAFDHLLDSLGQEVINSLALASNETNDLAYFWSISSLEKILTPEELSVAKVAFQLKNLGNVPIADDPSRLFFRRNTLGLKTFGPELASATGLGVAESEALLASAIEKISARRTEIMEAGDSLLVESMPALSSRARLLTAMARAHAKKPSEKTAELLEQLGQEILTDFITGEGELLRVPSIDGRRAISAQAFDYLATIESLLEWYRVSWNSELLDTARKLATSYLDRFINEEGFPQEVSLENTPLNFPVYSRAMIFGPSTWGTSYGVLRTLSALGFEHEKLALTLNAITPRSELGLQSASVIHTDYLLGAANHVEEYLLVLSANELENRALRLQLAQPPFDGVIAVVENTAFPSLPSPQGKAAVLLKDGQQVASYQTAAEIENGLRSELAK